MTDPVQRAFQVRARHLDRHHARRLNQTSFAAAALDYAEDFGPGGAVSVIVRDLATGDEQCFRIDLDEAWARACD